MAPLALCVAPLAVGGQPLPTGTDESLRQQERDRVLREQQQRTIDVRLPSPALPSGLERLPADEAACIPVRSLRLVGDGAERFRWALAHAERLSDGTADAATGRCLGTQGVNLVMRRINRDVATGRDAANALRPISNEQEIQAGFEIVGALANQVGTLLVNRARESDAIAQQARDAEQAAKERSDSPDSFTFQKYDRHHFLQLLCGLIVPSSAA
jgi:hypothetical protein